MMGGEILAASIFLPCLSATLIVPSFANELSGAAGTSCEPQIMSSFSPNIRVNCLLDSTSSLSDFDGTVDWLPENTDSPVVEGCVG